MYPISSVDSKKIELNIGILINTLLCNPQKEKKKKPTSDLFKYISEERQCLLTFYDN